MSKLSTKVFNIDFEMLYQKRYWPKEFGTYAFIDKDKVILNICFHRLELEENSRRCKALQIGTVSTYEEYRNQGLSRQLIEAVIENFESEMDVMYLSANESVLDFYQEIRVCTNKTYFIQTGQSI